MPTSLNETFKNLFANSRFTREAVKTVIELQVAFYLETFELGTFVRSKMMLSAIGKIVFNIDIALIESFLRIYPRRLFIAELIDPCKCGFNVQAAADFVNT